MMELFKTQFDFLSRSPRGRTTALPFQKKLGGCLQFAKPTAR